MTASASAPHWSHASSYPCCMARGVNGLSKTARLANSSTVSSQHPQPPRVTASDTCFQLCTRHAPTHARQLGEDQRGRFVGDEERHPLVLVVADHVQGDKRLARVGVAVEHQQVAGRDAAGLGCRWRGYRRRCGALIGLHARTDGGHRRGGGRTRSRRASRRWPNPLPVQQAAGSQSFVVGFTWIGVGQQFEVHDIGVVTCGDLS